jgi:hypothetical protein
MDVCVKLRSTGPLIHASVHLRGSRAVGDDVLTLAVEFKEKQVCGVFNVYA